MEKIHEYKAERDLYEENIDKKFKNELEDQTATMMEAHKVSLKIHNEIDHKQEEHMIHRLMNSSAATILSIITMTIMIVTYIIRKKTSSLIKMVSNHKESLEMLKSMSRKMINAQKRTEANKTPKEDDTKEISNEIVVPNTSIREKWRDTLGRVFNIATISDDFSTRLNLQILELVEDYENQ